MNCSIENRTIICVFDSSIIGANVKGILEVLKPELDSIREYDAITLNLNETKSIDSMGITFLIGLYKTYASKEKKIKLMGVSKELLYLFKIMKLDEIFNIEA
jgi:anti-anti-sigma factor